MFNPLVSILIPTHRPEYFRKALACALSQTYKNKEIIVFDNSNSDEIKLVSESAEGVRYFKNSDGLGETNISAGLRVAQGDYIKYIFDDDLIFPHTIQSMIGAMSKYDMANIGIVTSHRQVIDKNDYITAVKRLLNFDSPSLLNGRDVIELMLRNVSNFIGEYSTVLLNKKFLPAHDPRDMFKLFGADFRGLADVPLYISVLSMSDMLFLPYELSAFRRHEESGSSPVHNPFFYHAVTDWLLAIEIAFNKKLLSPENLANALDSYEKLSSKFLTLYPEQIGLSANKVLELRSLCK